MVFAVWLMTPVEPGMPKEVMTALEESDSTPVDLLKVHVWPPVVLV